MVIPHNALIVIRVDSLLAAIIARDNRNPPAEMPHNHGIFPRGRLRHRLPVRTS